MKRKIVVCDHIHAKGLELLINASDIEYVNISDLPRSEIYPYLADADVAITRSSTDVDEKFLAASPKMSAIVRAGVGVDNVDIPSCSKQGVIVMNVPTANTIAAVELTMCHMLSAMRSFPYAHSELKDKRVWKRENWYGRELSGKKLGVIGFGNIGSRVAVRAKAFGMDVIAYDPYINPHKAADLGVSSTSNFDDILACDMITIHTPKNKETTNMITAKEIAKMKDGVILINCARGGLYNEEDLVAALKSKKVSFAGIDVFMKEPATSHPLLDLDNVTVTPHLGANTQESQEKIAIEAAQQALDAARGIAYPNAMNLPVKMGETPEWVTLFSELAQKMGFLAAQFNKGAMSSIIVSAQGDVAEYVNALKTFAVVGVLRESLGEKVNYVNAEFVATEREIRLEAKKVEGACAYKNKLTIQITTQNGISFSLSGTVFDKSSLRIVEINGFEIDVAPKGKMILFKNKDVPGVIGSIGTTLGTHNVNIADFRLSRDVNANALALIIIDNEIDKALLEELAKINGAISVSYASL